jgi:hypothetical protein
MKAVKQLSFAANFVTKGVRSNDYRGTLWVFMLFHRLGFFQSCGLDRGDAGQYVLFHVNDVTLGIADNVSDVEKSTGQPYHPLELSIARIWNLGCFNRNGNRRSQSTLSSIGSQGS